MNSMQAMHLQTGQRGEAVAVRYLRRQQFLVLARNVRLGRDEIDIVAWDPLDRVIVFAEVKSRSRYSNNYHPDLNITPLKRHRMARAARLWVARHSWQGGYRLDVLCVADGNVTEHYREIAWETAKKIRKCHSAFTYRK